MTDNLAQLDCLFTTDNDMEIPTLSLDCQPKLVEIPFVCFGEQRRTFNMFGKGTLHFYTDDYRFSAVYDHPDRITKHHPSNIVEPNFTLFNETPIAFGLQAVYKKRFIARMMQQCGIGVFVDLNVAPKFYKLNMLGVPRGYSSYCTRGYSNRLDYLEFEYKLAQDWAESNRLLFVVYGGGKVAKQFCKMHGCVYVEQFINVKNTLKSNSQTLIRQTVAFNDSPINNLTEQSLRELQVSDYTKLIGNK